MFTFSTQPRSPSRSPMRYPGGKGFFAHSLAKMIEMNARTRVYAEPYAGGASAALQLLADQKIDKVLLNDADPRIFAVWKCILQRNDEFVALVKNTEVSMNTWYRCREIATSGVAEDQLDLAFATYFLNRTNRSGIVLGAGPIGGYEQAGNWSLDARYSKETMIDRIKWIGSQAQKINITSMDGLKFIQNCHAVYEKDALFLFVDPPYVAAGSRLYMNGMDEAAHKALAEQFKKMRESRWALTYDDCELIRSLYQEFEITSLSVVYSLQKKRRANEVLVIPKSILNS